MAFSPTASALLQRLRDVRSHSEALIAGLEPEDLCLQGMADSSPGPYTPLTLPTTLRV